MGEELIAHAARLFRQSHIPDYRFPERAASAMRVLTERARQLATPVEEIPQFDDVSPDTARELLAKVEVGEAGFVESTIAAEVARTYGIQTPPEIFAHSVDEVLEAADQLNYPVALKIVSSDLPHKSEMGGVLLDLESPEQVVVGFESMMEAASQALGQRKISGVVVQSMVSKGQDVIAGVVRDEQFGPLVMFGLGGVEVEALNDVAFALAPLTRHEAEDMLDRTWAGLRLLGYRSMLPADREAVVDVLLRLSQLSIDLPQVAEIEVNPLRALPGEGGALALDVRLRLSR
jgi:acetyltransferase